MENNIEYCDNGLCHNPEMKCYCKNKVGHAEMRTLPFIVAIDFDGTLVEDKFPLIGRANEKLFAEAIRWKALGYKLVLWTCRDNNGGNRMLDAAVEYCREHGLEFDSVNKNIPEVIEMFNNDTRKIYANVYIDDKNTKPNVVEVLKRWEPKEFQQWRLKVQ